MNALQRANLSVTKAQIITAKSQPKETAMLFPIEADEIKALGHSSYTGACQSLKIATWCDSKTNMSWRDTQANSEGVKFAWMKLFISTVLFLPLLWPLVVPLPMSLHRIHLLLWAVDGSRGPSGQSNDIQTWKKLCFLFSFASYEVSIDHILIIPLPGQHYVKFLLNFGHYGPFAFSVTGQPWL